MTILAFGLNHNTAPVALREQVSFSNDVIPDALKEFNSQRGVHETAILSTCNRTEVYCNLEQARKNIAVDWLSDFHHLPRSELRRCKAHAARCQRT